MNLSEYKDIFGKPREGTHKQRIPLLDVALNDVAAVLIFSLIVALMGGCSFLIVSITIFAMGIIAHRMFGVRTKVDQLLFSE